MYDVGEHEAGESQRVPYYTMRYVAGASLADVVRDERISPQAAARVIRDVALAVQAAHDHLILHRDLKPQNVILDRNSGAPYVADFGLAKLLEEEISQTVTGEILGTPPYMPPEQARDSGSATTRSDVYGLGATLYHALTGRPPFLGNSHLEVLQKVADEAPIAPRTLREEIDPDLEVICLKCLEKDPQQRYDSARALADDLTRWLNGESISARPPSTGERVLRWCRRNPLAGSLAGATVLSILIALFALWSGYSSTQAALVQVKASNRQARATVNDFFTIVSEDVLLNQPALQPLRRELLERALAHYESFLEESTDDPELAAEVARTHYRIGRITEVLESSESALVEYERAEKRQRKLYEASPGDSDSQKALADTLNAKGACHVRLGELDQAHGAFAEAEHLRKDLAERSTENAESARLLANVVMNGGLALRHADRIDQAARKIRESIALRNQIAKADRPTRAKIERDQGMAHFNLANLWIDENELTQAATSLDAAIERFARRGRSAAGGSDAAGPVGGVLVAAGGIARRGRGCPGSGGSLRGIRSDLACAGA